MNVRNDDGSSALGAAAFLGRAEMSKMLMDAGIDTSIRNDSGQSAQDIARLDWATTEYFASMFGIPLSDPEAVEKDKGEIARMLRAKL